MRKTNLARIALFLAVAAAHLLLVLFFAITVDAVIMTPEQPVSVMKLTDFEEEIPLPPPPPPPPPPQPAPENAVETIAETMIETEEAPDDQVLADPGTLIVSQAPPVRAEEPAAEDYLPMHKISVPPVFSEREIIASLAYPAIALRSGIEGTVYLELFVDRRGVVKQITILRENPPGRGFGEAAVNAFRGLTGKPAEANGVPVAVRYRYPVRFTIKG
ncbi:MAG: energy transducer TonB [Treponema sp.]|jgi:protein TonB|nr:energy transducer TonB [Treponema sp.]